MTATFGQRGAQPSAPSAPVFQAEPAGQPEPAEKKPGFLETVFGIDLSRDDEFDFRLTEEYAEGKTLWIAVPLWLFLGGLGAHRFYLGHIKLGFAILGLNILMGFLTFSSVLSLAAEAAAGREPDLAVLGGMLAPMIAFGLWVLGDGIYVIVRKLRPM